MKRILVIFLLLFYSSSAWSAAFDDRYPSVKATAMSNAYVAVANDVWAAYYNPAGLAQIDGIHTGFSYLRPYNMSFFKNFFF